MYILLIIVTVLVCALLGLIVLIQNPKGGGLASNFSSSSQLMGVQKTGDFLEKGTWALAIALMVLTLAINVSVKGGTSGNDNSDLREKINNNTKATPAPTNQVPFTPAAKPADKK
ncbi:preprotein translocase subunit SecG [Mucilaginibacter oryzae]|uniref:Protein-export membrane protein SecG n=1 Tax=Mucilaginibacter oryzae TaxID=468058 RepID=A0A316H7P3_9SPHI|nr:preprotein translocase subunit SecG [Mucilaginibacter oryzae]PWK76496.1 preprotein translocase subunit SecG [Mucilaginibacter oryzae]